MQGIGLNRLFLVVGFFLMRPKSINWDFFSVLPSVYLPSFSFIQGFVG